ncbi:MAG: carbohydrate kinase [Bacteroidales bacterium]|nr:carbohydrate kinase [Bacteroidales bacterium]MBO7640399.1 carbohydrate kinase [Bacteroidales bacterium]MBR3291527.1 carbohydrate kinase [Bacteroidales bacterium]
MNAQKKVIVGIGEILWDMLPTGKALGGAPANFAYHAKRLGEDGWAVSAIGNDALGREIMEIVMEKGLRNLISVTSRPTGTVQVSLDAKGVPSYTIMEDVAWDNIPFTPQMAALASRADAVCFGSLVQRGNSRDSVLRFLRAMRPEALRVFDINLRQHYYSKEVIDESLQLSDILKINDEEIRIVAELFGLGGDDTAACRALIERYGLKLVILTRGADGSEVITADEAIPQAVGQVEVVDTVGAGDSFTAAFVVAYLRGDSLADAQRLANETAAYVCSCKGAMPI